MCIGGSEDGIVRGMVNKLVLKKIDWFQKIKLV